MSVSGFFSTYRVGFRVGKCCISDLVIITQKKGGTEIAFHSVKHKVLCMYVPHVGSHKLQGGVDPTVRTYLLMLFLLFRFLLVLEPDEQGWFCFGAFWF